jgi:transcriptional regulator with XRE-family HTH domain
MANNQHVGGAMWAKGAQLRAARVLLQVRQRALAEQLAVSVNSLQRAEADHPGSRRTQRQLQQWLAHEGIEFSADGGIRHVPAAPPPAPEPAPEPAAAEVIERRGGLVRRNGMWWPAPRTA